MHLIELRRTTNDKTIHRKGLDGAVSSFELHLVELGMGCNSLGIAVH